MGVPPAVVPPLVHHACQVCMSCMLCLADRLVGEPV